MAFQKSIFANFYNLLKTTLRSNPESQAIAENFILEDASRRRVKNDMVHL